MNGLSLLSAALAWREAEKARQLEEFRKAKTSSTPTPSKATSEIPETEKENQPTKTSTSHYFAPEAAESPIRRPSAVEAEQENSDEDFQTQPVRAKAPKSANSKAASKSQSDDPKDDGASHGEVSEKDQSAKKTTVPHLKLPKIYFTSEELMKAESCRFYNGVRSMIKHPSICRGGKTELWDIEDLTKLGKKVKGCPYYTARGLAETAEIIFAPYNYLVDPLIRQAAEIDLKDNIVIIDEAHNIEDASSDAGR
ncbi:hypothetical protein HK102_000877 [Quaeritorhiza haematococci]|nr:hypothetical protein HK102_000877 [Quaeritorhiza haematococci]